MKKIFILIFNLLVIVIFFSNSLQAKEEPLFGIDPPSRISKKWHIAYYEGGNHDNYYDYLLATVKGLMELGWIRQMPVAENAQKNTQLLWQWLSKEINSPYLEFLENGFYSANWSRDARVRIRRDILTRLNNTGDIDLILAMGTWAGEDLANNEHSTPTMVISTSDPISSRIIDSVEDSGYDHVHARVDPRRYERQIQVFHDLTGFKKLGVAYENTDYGRAYAAVHTIEKISQERDFKILRCYTQSDIADQNLAQESVVNCFEQLAREADALYVTMQGGVNLHTIPKIVEIANRYRVPTFSQLGAEEVRYGLLLSLSRSGFRSVGMFLAATMTKIINGAKPRDLRQLFEESPKFAINLKTAEIIGFYLYADVLAAADEIYREIEMPR